MAAVVVAAVVASHRDAACVYVCVSGIPVARTESDTCAVAQKMTVIQVIILVLKKKPLSRRPRPSRLPVAARLSAPLSDRRTERDGMNWRSRLFHEGFPGD